LLVAYVLPVGVRGIVVAGLLRLDELAGGVFNASATLFTIDFYARLRPEAARRSWSGLADSHSVMVLIGLIWIRLSGRQGAFDYLQACSRTSRRRSSWCFSSAFSGSG
jgi:SSS family solute:Na+ symporter